MTSTVVATQETEVQARRQLFTRDVNCFPIQTPGSPQVHEGPCFLNIFQGRQQFTQGSYFPPTDSRGATSSHGDHIFPIQRTGADLGLLTRGSQSVVVMSFYLRMGGG